MATFVFCTQQTILSKLDDLIRSLGKNRAVFLEFLFSEKRLFEMLSALFHLFSIPQMHFSFRGCSMWLPIPSWSELRKCSVDIWMQLNCTNFLVSILRDLTPSPPPPP